MKNNIISVIVACYNEEENIGEMYKRIVNVFKNNKSYDYEIIFVDNDSTDTSEKLYNNLAKKDKKVKIIFMSRNFGSPQSSFLAGLENIKGDASILLHGDIQDPPELIPKFIQKWEKGYEVVYGIRKTRKGYGILMNFFYKSFYYLLQKLSYIKIPLNAGDFSLIDRKVINELLKIEEYDYYLRCLRAYVGFKQIGIEYVRDARKHGKTNENFLTGLWWAKTIIINFSFQPLEFISKIAFLVMSFSFIFIIINIILILIYRNSPPGIPTIVILILFLGGIQLLSLSIIAEYLAKIFLEVKKRPKYIIKRKLNIS
ncbi:MAG: Glycosyl transferase family protein [Candidatus Roizmanbacteria bacterium GW2011_GWA2_32_13]|uniref:Glycosyl transferase family protein n=1 Tax=Candidatus Roizmanbacteria bacterium GW2011_GWA2_32_13 TaxID=1618475 RepID=A0A0G0BUY7_9BACT|nr:MAG: Glycosyl transferase family protein [Candidatus Roizmanbacteria bacterium GW2011_GWA2_32_13]